MRKGAEGIGEQSKLSPFQGERYIKWQIYGKTSTVAGSGRVIGVRLLPLGTGSPPPFYQPPLTLHP